MTDLDKLLSLAQTIEKRRTDLQAIFGDRIQAEIDNYKRYVAAIMKRDMEPQPLIAALTIIKECKGLGVIAINALVIAAVEMHHD